METQSLIAAGQAPSENGRTFQADERYGKRMYVADDSGGLRNTRRQRRRDGGRRGGQEMAQGP